MFGPEKYKGKYEEKKIKKKSGRKIKIKFKINKLICMLFQTHFFYYKDLNNFKMHEFLIIFFFCIFNVKSTVKKIIFLAFFFSFLGTFPDDQT